MSVADDAATTMSEEAMAALDGVVRGDLSALPELARQHNVLLLAVFGSTAKGARHPESDLDLAVLFLGPTPEGGWLPQEIQLEIALEDLLLPVCEMQVVALNRVAELLQKEVADHGIVLYADHPDRWLLYRISASRNFEDTEKYRRRRWNDLLKKYGLLTDESDAREQVETTG